MAPTDPMKVIGPPLARQRLCPRRLGLPQSGVPSVTPHIGVHGRGVLARASLHAAPPLASASRGWQAAGPCQDRKEC